MATGTGLDASIGFGQETSFGVPKTVDHWFPFDSETLNRQKNTVQATGLRGGTAYSALAAGRRQSTRDAKGNVVLDYPNQGAGLLLNNMLGTVSTTNVGAAYTQVHTLGSLLGKSLTCQVGRPSVDGVVNPFTYVGCKFTDWELSLATDALLKLNLGIDAKDELTLANAPTGLAVATAGTAGSTTYGYRVSAVLASGETSACATVTITTGNATLTGTNKNNLTWNAVTGAATYNVYGRTAFGETLLKTGVSTTSYSDTGADTPGAQVALSPQLTSPSYASSLAGFSFTDANTLTLGGTTIAAVKKFSVKPTNPSKVDRFYIGSGGTKAEQVGNGWRTVAGTLEAEFVSRAALYDAYQADTQLALQFKVSGGYIPTTTTPYSMQVDIAALFLDGDTPNVAGPDILTQTVPFVGLYDGTNSAIKVTNVTSDTAL